MHSKGEPTHHAVNQACPPGARVLVEPRLPLPCPIGLVTHPDLLRVLFELDEDAVGISGIAEEGAEGVSFVFICNSV